MAPWGTPGSGELAVTWWNWWVEHLGLADDDDEDTDGAEDAFLDLVYREFPVLLAHRLPNLSLEIADDGALLIRQRGDTDEPVVMNLPRMARRLGTDAEVEDRQEAYESWLETLRQVLSPDEVDPTWANRLLPRLVTPDWVAASNADGQLLVREVPGLGLHAALVFDFPTSVQYVSRSELDPMGLTEREAHARALDNLRDRLPPELVRDVVESDRHVRYSALDGYEAARILVVPEILEPGEAVGAAIPDRNSLVLFPADQVETFGDAMASPPGEDRLVDEALWVTADGFERPKQ